MNTNRGELMSRRRVGFMGGTFDPIHHGHLVTAESVYESFDLEVVIFIPAGSPPHKPGSEVTEAHHRLNMTRLATESNPHFSVSSVEIEREGPSYTIETMRYFRGRYGPEADLYFITGVDAVMEMRQWRNSEGLFELCTFIAATRPGYPTDSFFRFRDQLSSEHRKAVKMLAVPALAISSSDLQRRVCSGRSIKYLVPEPVERYIYDNGLYHCPDRPGQAARVQSFF